MRNLIVIVFCLAFAGCVTTQKSFGDPQYGMTRVELVKTLGRPRAVEVYRKTDLTELAFYFYVKKYQSSETTVPVCLIDNKVVGWGRSFYEDHVGGDVTRIR